MTHLHPSLATRLIEQARDYGVLYLTDAEHTAMRHYIIDHPHTIIMVGSGDEATACLLARIGVAVLPDLELTS